MGVPFVDSLSHDKFIEARVVDCGQCAQLIVGWRTIFHIYSPDEHNRHNPLKPPNIIVTIISINSYLSSPSSSQSHYWIKSIIVIIEGKFHVLYTSKKTKKLH